MKRKADDKRMERRKKYRTAYQEGHKKLFSTRLKNPDDIKILDLIFKPYKVDMEKFYGTQSEFQFDIEQFYENRGPEFTPKMEYPPIVLDNWGQDFALQAQGIYYLNGFSKRAVCYDRKVWRPKLADQDEETPETLDRQARAKILASHSRNNENWCKSEFAWEADAWADVFGRMREDPSLEIDKRGLSCIGPKTDPLLCTLTGELELKTRIPDATFGLATFSDQNSQSPYWVHDLHRSRLEKLLLHPNYGLCSDPKLDDDIALAFPFLVYEAKGWRGDHRDARRQATFAASCYLDMLDNLARKPGPLESPRVYQTKTSHQYQVFVLTSFGAYWHLLVGHRRPRSKEEHVDEPGMSATAYIFQKVWSGDVTNESRAFELLSLLDQIHIWSTTEYRTFIIEHLRAWHESCEKNYHLEWDSLYDLGDDKKRVRVLKEDTNLALPKWTDYLSGPQQQKLQVRAKLALRTELLYRDARKGKLLASKTARPWVCVMHGCNTEVGGDHAFLEHLSSVHKYEPQKISAMRFCLVEGNVKKLIKERQVSKITPSGHKWPYPWDMPQIQNGEKIRFPPS